jgi:excisionase family DNA binding protein
MTSSLSDLPNTVTPSAADTQLARESSQKLALLLAARRTNLRLLIQPDDDPEETIAIPLPALGLFADILKEMAKGNAVALIPVNAELTLEQAADLLNVSCRFLSDRLEKGEISSRMIGTQHRILLQDVMAYKQQTDQKRLKALEELSALDQELGLGYSS